MCTMHLPKTLSNVQHRAVSYCWIEVNAYCVTSGGGREATWHHYTMHVIWLPENIQDQLKLYCKYSSSAHQAMTTTSTSKPDKIIMKK